MGCGQVRGETAGQCRSRREVVPSAAFPVTDRLAQGQIKFIEHAEETATAVARAGIGATPLHLREGEWVHFRERSLPGQHPESSQSIPEAGLSIPHQRPYGATFGA